MPKVLVIEGAIGAGKTTLLRILEQRLPFAKIVTVPEPVEVWKETGALREFYADVKGKAIEFQTFVFATRLQALKQAWKVEPAADLYILERSPFSDKYIFIAMLHQGGLITDAQLARYNLWWESWIDLWPVTPTHFLHLKPSLAACMERTEKRARAGETVTKDYQAALMQQHETFFRVHCSQPVLDISDEVDYREPGPAQDQLVQRVHAFLMQRRPLGPAENFGPN